MDFRKNHIDIVSMGCSKNLVDSERLLKRLEAKGYTCTPDPEVPEGEYVVVNTCGFINDAKEESIQVILELEEMKKEGAIGNLIVMGCLSQRYMDDLKTEIPGVDRWYGKFDWNDFVETLPDRKEEKRTPKEWERTLTTPSYSAYMKVSEGCDRMCAFCAIPLITGRHKSRKIEEILEETKQLVSEGVKEFNVIAQDLSSYGLDFYGEQKLAELIDRMADIPGVEWIRLHYAYPAQFPMDVLDVMARRDNVCKYLDIALQHASDKVLDNMRRHISKEETIRLLDEIRRRVPGIKIRTTLMTGFPGEDEEAYNELREFVRTQRFDRMGAFAYSEENDTYAARHFEDSIPEDIKQKRLDEIMSIQENISQELNDELVGKELRVLIDRVEPGQYVGRTEWDSPEVDPEVIIPIYDEEESMQNLNPGDMVNVRVTDAYPFELEAEIITGK